MSNEQIFQEASDLYNGRISEIGKSVSAKLGRETYGKMKKLARYGVAPNMYGVERAEAEVILQKMREVAPAERIDSPMVDVSRILNRE